MEWEAYDESDWGAAGALDWDHNAQVSNPGLLFRSRADWRRLWPSPGEWWKLPDEGLEDLCRRAASLWD
jgi:hypothetical protein